MKTIILPDLHGCFYTLLDALSTISVSTNDRLIFLGDYLNKGPHSYRLINLLIDLKDKMQIVLLKGNHESVFLQSLRDTNISLIQSYLKSNIAAMFTGKELESKYSTFFDSLLPYFVSGEFLFVHAGIDLTQESLHEQQSYYYYERTKGKAGDHNINHVIHGHFITDSKLIDNNARMKRFDLALDNGCYLSGKVGYGELITFDIETFSPTFHKKSKHDE